MSFIINYVREAKQNPIFISIEMLPNVKSLRDILVHTH